MTVWGFQAVTHVWVALCTDADGGSEVFGVYRTVDGAKRAVEASVNHGLEVEDRLTVEWVDYEVGPAAEATVGPDHYAVDRHELEG